MTHLSLFSGIGGIDLSAEWAGFESVGMVEKDEFCQKVLRKHWPEVPIYDDVTTFDGTRYRGVDLISGGFPCQPHSLAGSRKASGDERDLWGEVVRIVGEAKPRWFLGENVPGLFSSESGAFFGRILDDLAQMGYRVGWAMYGASDTGAVHRRNRVFIVAYSDGERCEEGRGVRHIQHTERSDCGGQASDVAYADCGGSQNGRQSHGAEMGRCDCGRGSPAIIGSEAPECGSVGHTDCQRCEEFPDGIPAGAGDFDGGIVTDAASLGRERLSCGETRSCEDSRAAKGEGRRLCESCREDGGANVAYAGHIADGQADTPAGTIGSRREPRNDVGWGDRPRDWRDWGISPTVRLEPRVRGGDARISAGLDRVNRLKALGNAVCPQQIAPILKAIADQIRGEG